MKERKKGSGGARPGAGRPRKMSKDAIALERALTGSGTCELGWNDGEVICRVMTLPDGVSITDYVDAVTMRNIDEMAKLFDEERRSIVMGLVFSVSGAPDVAAYLRVPVSKLVEYVVGIDVNSRDLSSSTLELLRDTQKSNDQKSKSVTYSR